MLRFGVESTIHKTAERHDIAEESVRKYAHQIAGRKQATVPGYNLGNLRTDLDVTFNIAAKLGLDLASRSEVIRTAEYIANNFEHGRLDNPLLPPIEKQSQFTMKAESEPFLERAYYSDYSDFISVAQRVGLGFPSEGAWNRSRIDWGHLQQEVLSNNPAARTVIQSEIERSLVNRYAMVLTDSEFPGSITMSEEQREQWTQIHHQKKNAVLERCKDAAAGLEIDSSLPSWDTLQQQQKLRFSQPDLGRLSNDTLAQVIAAFPKDDGSRRAYKRLTAFIAITLGERTFSEIAERARLYEERYAKEALRSQEHNNAVKTKGRELFSALSAEKYSHQEIAEHAAAFWLGGETPHTAFAPNTSFIGYGLSLLARASNRPDESKATKFRTVLISHIKTELELGRKVHLKTDYAPQDLLKDFADTYGIASSNFSEKTTMTIYPDRKNRLAIIVEQYDPYCYKLPISGETFKSSDAEELRQYRNILAVE